MTTVRAFIESSYRIIQEVGEGMPMSAQQGKDGLEVLIDLLDNLSLDPSFINTVSVESFTLTGSKASYTIGSGGDFDTSAPVAIEKAIIKENDLVISDLDVIGTGEYAASQDTATGIPSSLWYNKTQPLATISLVCVPSQAYTLQLFSKKPITTYSNLSDTLSFAHGYKMPLRFLLARVMAPEFGKSLTSDAEKIARRAIRFIKSANSASRNDILSCDEALLGSGYYDIRTGP